MTDLPCLSGSKEDDGGSVDYDSFLQPLLHDLKVLATDGVDAKEYDAVTGRLGDETFKLRAHLITICGDMPAVAKVGTQKRSAPLSSAERFRIIDYEVQGA
jgi:hypothetical protein